VQITLVASPRNQSKHIHTLDKLQADRRMGDARASRVGTVSAPILILGLKIMTNLSDRSPTT